MNESDLKNELIKTHSKLAQRNNASSNTIINSAQLGKDFFTAVASALLTLGETHGPLTQTANLFSHPNPVNYVLNLLDNNLLIPGWGSSFVKGKEDPAFDTIKNILQEKHEDVYKIIGDITAALHLEEKKLFPNAACYTIATMFALDLDPRMSFKLFITSRIDWWHHVYMCYYRPGPI